MLCVFDNPGSVISLFLERTAEKCTKMYNARAQSLHCTAHDLLSVILKMFSGFVEVRSCWKEGTTSVKFNLTLSLTQRKSFEGVHF